MAGFPVTPGSGGNIAADQVGTATAPAAGDRIQYVKIDLGVAGSSAPVTASNNGLPVDAAGTKVTAASIPSGGIGFLGWLSAIWYQLTQTLAMSLAAVTSGGATASRFMADGSTYAGNIKTSAGNLYTLSGSNIGTGNLYLRIYNKASAPIPGTDTPVLEYVIPPGGRECQIPAVGSTFAAGIGWVFTSGTFLDSDTTPVTVNAGAICWNYK
jgi:hypothetical protein